MTISVTLVVLSRKNHSRGLKIWCNKINLAGIGQPVGTTTAPAIVDILSKQVKYKRTNTYSNAKYLDYIWGTLEYYILSCAL